MASLKFEGIPVCPYCGRVSQYTYNPRYCNYIYECVPCDARIGCHNNTNIPLGSLANKELRKLRIRTHDVFDSLWRNGHMQRKQAYNWLSQKLGIHYLDTHIGMFREEECKKTIDLCGTYFPHIVFANALLEE